MADESRSQIRSPDFEARGRIKFGGGQIRVGTNFAVAIVVLVALALLVGFRFSFPNP